jgi:hypothetical protein
MAVVGSAAVRRLAVAMTMLSAAIAAPTASVAASDPAWVRPAAVTTANRWFAATPVRIDTIAYPRKLAVVLTFERVVVCRVCSAPSNAQTPRARIVRFAFDRATHRPGDGHDLAIHFCRTRQQCLYR